MSERLPRRQFLQAASALGLRWQRLAPCRFGVQARRVVSLTARGGGLAFDYAAGSPARESESTTITYSTPTERAIDSLGPRIAEKK